MKNSDRNQTIGIFDSMLQLPLIKGVGEARLREIFGHMKIRFSKAKAGESVAEAGEPCRELKFLLSGKVRMVQEDANSELRVEQTLAAPQVIAPDCLFGLSTVYPCRVTALTDVGVMEISKEDYRRLLALDQVFLFNYLNMACSAAQRARRGLMAIAGGNPTERLAYWVNTLTQPGATDIAIRSQGRELHSIIGISAAALRTAAERLSATLAPGSLTMPRRF